MAVTDKAEEAGSAQTFVPTAQDSLEGLAAEVDRLPNGSEERFPAFRGVLKALDEKYGK
jgi:hypothetical protein